MQTFLPYRDFEKCARVLDRQRLGKQRVEVYQILRALNGESMGWRNHPAVCMWSGYTEALVDYGTCMCAEWERRGYEDNMGPRIMDYDWGGPAVIPPWLTHSLCMSYRSLLLRKNPQHYRRYWPDLSDSILFVWPTLHVLERSD